MASLDWGGKTHTGQMNPKIHRNERSLVKSIVTHCDADHRTDPDRKFKNEHIDSERTYLNQNFTGLTAEESVIKFNKRLKELDKAPGANLRADGVLVHCLEMPAPDDMTDEQAKEFFKDFYNMCVERFGEENIIGATSHFDEEHRYKNSDTGKWVRSRPHIHVQIMPVADGRLCDKEVASRDNIIQWNNDIKKLCNEKYHVRFNTQEPARHRSVEQMKSESRYLERLEKDYDRCKNYLDNIYIKDDMTALDDFEAGGTGTAVNSRDRKELRDEQDKNRELTDRLANMQQQVFDLQNQLDTYREKEEKIKRGIKRSESPELTERTYNELVTSLEMMGSDDVGEHIDIEQ